MTENDCVFRATQTIAAAFTLNLNPPFHFSCRQFNENISIASKANETTGPSPNGRHIPATTTPFTAGQHESGDPLQQCGRFEIAQKRQISKSLQIEMQLRTHFELSENSNIRVTMQTQLFPML